jgi:hypothetical protein
MVSAPALLLAFIMPGRSEPLPESFVLVTEKVEGDSRAIDGAEK